MGHSFATLNQGSSFAAKVEEIIRKVPFIMMELTSLTED